MTNLGSKRLPADKLLSVEVLKCNKCSKEYKPTKDDISTKNPNVYYKNCMKCRNYIYLKNHEFKKRQEDKTKENYLV